MKLAVFGLVVAGLLSAQAQARTNGNQLRGINQISLQFDRFNDDEKDCHITQNLIRDAFMYPASTARFIVKETVGVPHGLPFMDFNVNTILFKSDQLCFSNIDMRLRVFQDAKLEASGRYIFAFIEVWSVGSMLRVSDNGRHRQLVRDAIEGATKKFITDWNLDNK